MSWLRIRTPESQVGSTKCKTCDTELGICPCQASVSPFVPRDRKAQLPQAAREDGNGYRSHTCLSQCQQLSFTSCGLTVPLGYFLMIDLIFRTLL